MFASSWKPSRRTHLSPCSGLAATTPDLYAYKESGDLVSLRDPTSHMFKAVVDDDEDGRRILATAEWTFNLDPELEAARESTREDAPPPSNWPADGNWPLRRFYKM